MRTFRDAIRQRDIVVTAELSLRPATTSAEIKRAAWVLAPVVDAIQVGDDRSAVGHMSPLAAASLIMECGVDAIVNFSCRDRNRIALIADLLGAAALGVTTVIVNRGEKFTDSAVVRSKGVFEMTAAQLIDLAQKIGSENALVPDPGFNIGSSITVFQPAEDWDAIRVSEKTDSGVKFLQTQPCLNAILLREYMQKLVERKLTHRASVVVEVPLLTSAKAAKSLKAAYKGATVPGEAIQRIVDSRDPVATGIAVCAEMMAEARDIPGISGVNVRHDAEAENIVAAIRQSKLKQS